MKIITTARDFRDLKLSTPIGFVPTMGALHAAHLSLIGRAVSENAVSVVSIFVNPTQFNDQRDFDVYPRPLEADLRKCEDAKVDFAFVPIADDLYFDDEVLLATPEMLGSILEGACRPGHFDGVLRVVLKLINIVSPTKMYLGQKDAQQLAIISKMVNDLFVNVEIVPCELIRESDGLAMSSRNALLSTDERVTALSLSKAVRYVEELCKHGERDVAVLQAAMIDAMMNVTKIEYAEIRRRDFSVTNVLDPGNSIALVAAFVGKTRLIDNMLL